jgi:type I restriction enzyme S subunit
MKKGWQTKQLGELAELKGRIGWRGLTAKEYTREGPLFLSVHSLNYGDYVDFRDAFHISEERYVESPEIMLQPNDVLICKDGAGIGKLGILGELPDRATINSSLLLIRSGKQILPKYLYRCLTSPYFQDIVQSRLNGATTPHLYQRDITEFPVVLPPLAEQQRIVGLLDEAFEGLATAKANAEKNLQNARALFESHLQSVFTQRGPGWAEKKVSEIAKHSLGKMLDKAKNKGEPQPYLRNINVRWFTFDLSDLLQMPFLPTEAEKYTAIKGDVLICEGGYPGRAAIWDEDYPIYFQKALHRVRFHQPELSKWFVYYLSVQDSSGQLKRHFSGTGIQHFTGEVLARFPIPVPPLPELRRAVAKFDALSEETQRLARLYERKHAALEALKKSLLHQAFSGEL